jgi:hypothetical protein
LNSLNVNEFEKLILTKYSSKGFKYIKRMDWKSRCKNCDALWNF